MQAWTQDPKTANTARFHWDPKSWYAEPMYFIDSGLPLTGAPPLLKTRSHMRRKIRPQTAVRYGRTVAEVFAGGRNVNLEIVRIGAAYAYHQYLSGCDESAYLGAEDQAEHYRQGGVAMGQRREAMGLQEAAEG